MQIQKLKLGQQNNDEGSINLAGVNKKASLKCKKIIIKTLANVPICLLSLYHFDRLSSDTAAVPE